MPSVQFLYISLETKPLKLTIEKKKPFYHFWVIFSRNAKTRSQTRFTSHSAVELKGGDSVGLGMVRDGTKCGAHKVRYH